jgi:hypothetical protein
MRCTGSSHMASAAVRLPAHLTRASARRRAARRSCLRDSRRLRHQPRARSPPGRTAAVSRRPRSLVSVYSDGIRECARPRRACSCRGRRRGRRHRLHGGRRHLLASCRRRRRACGARHPSARPRLACYKNVFTERARDKHMRISMWRLIDVRNGSSPLHCAQALTSFDIHVYMRSQSSARSWARAAWALESGFETAATATTTATATQQRSVGVSEGAAAGDGCACGLRERRLQSGRRQRVRALGPGIDSRYVVHQRRRRA